MARHQNSDSLQLKTFAEATFPNLCFGAFGNGSKSVKSTNAYILSLQYAVMHQTCRGLIIKSIPVGLSVAGMVGMWIRRSVYCAPLPRRNGVCFVVCTELNRCGVLIIMYCTVLCRIVVVVCIV